jgi:hypothetical protein
VQSGLKEAIEEADHVDPNWRLADLEAGRKETADSDNALLQVAAAQALMPIHWPAWESFPSAGTSVEVRNRSQLLCASFAGLEAPFQLSDLQATNLRSELHRAEEALSKARKIAEMPYGIEHLQQGPYDVSAPGASNAVICRVANLLWYDVILLAQDGDLSQSLHSARALLNEGRSLGDEPILESQLMRINVDSLTRVLPASLHESSGLSCYLGGSRFGEDRDGWQHVAERFGASAAPV